MNMDERMNLNFSDISSNYVTFAQEKHACCRCSLYEHYKHVGQSEGNACDPTFLFVGEALGKDEVGAGKPFVGRAGQRLRLELRKYKKVFNKKSVLISNVLPCRPLNNKFPKYGDKFTVYPDNRKKEEKSLETDAQYLVNNRMKHWLHREIKITKPKVIVTLGAIPLEYVYGEKGITNSRGTWKFIPQIRAWALATFHPSYVLRCVNDPDKAYVVDMFEQDIAKVAKTWRSIVDNDYRMRLSDADWEKRMGLEAKSYLFKGLGYVTND